MKTFFDILGVVLGCACAFCLIASTTVGNPTLLLTSVGSYIVMIGCYAISSRNETDN